MVVLSHTGFSSLLDLLDNTTWAVWRRGKFFFSCYIMCVEESLAAKDLRWVEFFPSAKFQNGYEDNKMSAEPRMTTGWVVNGWNFNFEWTVLSITRRDGKIWDVQVFARRKVCEATILKTFKMFCVNGKKLVKICNFAKEKKEIATFQNFNHLIIGWFAGCKFTTNQLLETHLEKEKDPEDSEPLLWIFDLSFILFVYYL